MKSEIVDVVLEQLRQGRGAEVALVLSPTKSFRVVLIPSTLYSTNPNELLIACEGRGVHFYDGQTSLNEFKLTSSGFPLDLARQIAELVGHIMNKGRQDRPLTLPSEPQPKLKDGAKTPKA